MPSFFMLMLFLTKIIAPLPVLSKADCKTHYDFELQPLDHDGVPLCPAINPTATPWEYMSCAFNQAKSWHPPTPTEVEGITNLLSSIKEGDMLAAYQYGRGLGLQACRNLNNGDPYVVFVTQPGKTDYVGPFITAREKNASPLVMQDGHVQDCNSGNYPQTLFKDTHAILSITNGYPRAISGIKQKTCWGASYESDGTHNINNLFYKANEVVANLWPTSVFFHFHGMKGKGLEITNSLGWDVGNRSLLYAFAEEVKAVLAPRIKSDPTYLQTLRTCAPGTVLPSIRCQLVSTWIEGRFMAGSKDVACSNGNKNTNRWLGMEQGPEIRTNPQIMTKILLNIEQNYLSNAKVN